MYTDNARGYHLVPRCVSCRVIVLQLIDCYSFEFSPLKVICFIVFSFPSEILVFSDIMFIDKFSFDSFIDRTTHIIRHVSSIERIYLHLQTNLSVVGSRNDHN